MQRTLFGTDGIRGQANRFPMTAEVALALGRAAGRLFRCGSPPHRVVIGKDTRLSGYMLEPALTAGFISAGMDVILVGPMPTPAIAFLTRSLRCDLGVVVSASHNPFDDNGIKIFGPDGFKLSDETEAHIEVGMKGLGPDGDVSPAELGRARRFEDARGRYIESLKASFPRDRDLGGMRIVVDCANGAAYQIAPELFFELGAEVEALGISPDGFNINRGCGATAPEALRERVLASGADLGIALDGDADRLVLVDERGESVDGDRIIALIARDWQERGLLRRPQVVATVMSNLGLERFLAERGLTLLRTPVGDRYVVEAMRTHDCNLGGEQSGHIVLTDYATTGDGLLASLQLLQIMLRTGKPLSELAHIFEPVPQRLCNLRLSGPIDLNAPTIRQAREEAERLLGPDGRLLLRRSGTEPVVRIMVECSDPDRLDAALALVAQAVQVCAAESFAA
jgi:phosphoglucosamine mutase